MEVLGWVRPSLNSIGFELKEKEVMFIPAERFMYQFIKSIKANDMVKFKEYFRNTINNDR